MLKGKWHIAPNYKKLFFRVLLNQLVKADAINPNKTVAKYFGCPIHFLNRKYAKDNSINKNGKGKNNQAKINKQFLELRERNNVCYNQ